VAPFIIAGKEADFGILKFYGLCPLDLLKVRLEASYE
jgi:hypothetical protein